MVIPLDELQKAFQEKLRALHVEEAFNGLFDISISSKAPSGEILIRSRNWVFEVIWCEMRTVSRMIGSHHMLTLKAMRLQTLAEAGACDPSI
ncbi:hypothetical protein TNCV_1105411 [Trichonephila clavipes]|nr:hypothetical protein TNCV_1105411 [Trichonephila clavipes]